MEPGGKGKDTLKLRLATPGRWQGTLGICLKPDFTWGRSCEGPGLQLEGYPALRGGWADSEWRFNLPFSHL